MTGRPYAGYRYAGRPYAGCRRQAWTARQAAG
jgi:hypothetical protein